MLSRVYNLTFLRVIIFLLMNPKIPKDFVLADFEDLILFLPRTFYILKGLRVRTREDSKCRLKNKKGIFIALLKWARGAA